MSPPYIHVAWPTTIERNAPLAVGLTGSYAEYTTAPVFSLPSNIVAGELLLAIYNSSGDTANTLGIPSGWTSLYDRTSSPNENIRARAAYRIATGSEGSTITVTGSGAGYRYSCVTMRVRQFDDGVAPAVGDNVVGNSRYPNPPSLSPAWDEDETLWLAVAHSAAGWSVAYPANYSGGATGYTGAGNMWHARTSVASRALAAASEDPGTFDIANEYPWAATTIAILGDTQAWDPV